MIKHVKCDMCLSCLNTCKKMLIPLSTVDEVKDKLKSCLFGRTSLGT